MHVYYRHFQIMDADLVAKIIERIKARNKYGAKLNRLAKSIGAKAAYANADMRLTGFEFDRKRIINRDVFKPVQRGEGWYPKKNTAGGKQILEKINKLENPPGAVNALLDVYLPNGHTWCLMYIPSLYHAYIQGNESSGWFVGVPWVDEDPKKVEAYRASRLAGKSGDSNLDHLLWTPPEGWKPVKEWEVLRALDPDSKVEVETAQ